MKFIKDSIHQFLSDLQQLSEPEATPQNTSLQGRQNIFESGGAKYESLERAYVRPPPWLAAGKNLVLLYFRDGQRLYLKWI